MARSKKKAAYIAAESSFATDPSANGSGYAWIPALSLPDIPQGQELLPTDYFTSGPFPTTPIAGAQGGSFDMEIPVIGLATRAGDGTNASATADDWFDNCLESIFTDSPTERTGETVSSSTTSELTFDAGATDVTEQDLVAIYGSGDVAERSQWVVLTDDASDPAWAIAPNKTGTSSSVLYGTRQYHCDRNTAFGGSSQAIVIEDGGDINDAEQIGAYMFLGCRPGSFKLVGEAGQMYRGSVTWLFNDVTEDSGNKTALPAPGVGPAVTPLICLLSGFWFNGTQYATRRVDIDLGIQAVPRPATSAAQGRSAYDILTISPTITIEPLRTDAIRELRRGVTEGRLLVQLGAGLPSGTILNSCAVHAENAYVDVADPVDESGTARQTVTFRVTDGGEWESGTLGRYFNFARA